MSRRNRKKTAKIKAHIQGRKLRSIRKIQPLAGGLFVYRSNVYDIEDFPPHATINLDVSTVYPIREYEGSFDKSSLRKKKNKKQKLRKKTYAATVYSNLGECNDAYTILTQSTQN
jgi:hypothetical protein